MPRSRPRRRAAVSKTGASHGGAIAASWADNEVATEAFEEGYESGTTEITDWFVTAAVCTSSRGQVCSVVVPWWISLGHALQIVAHLSATTALARQFTEAWSEDHRPTYTVNGLLARPVV